MLNQTMLDQDPEEKEQRLLSICSALGGYEDTLGVDYTGGERPYIVGDEVLDCLRDLKRMLRQDDEISTKRFVPRLLGKWQILQKDLIPILRIADASGNDKLAMAVVELFVPLTWPVDMNSDDVPLQLELLRQYKAAFVQRDILPAVARQLMVPLTVNFRDRSPNDRGKIRLILTLVRNLLAIQDVQSSIQASASGYARSTHQELLVMQLQKSEILPVIGGMAAASEDAENVDHNLTLMEIYYHLFMERDAKHLADPLKHESKELFELVLQEQRDRQQNLPSVPKSRHPRFGGTLTFKMSSGKQFNVHEVTKGVRSVHEALDKDKQATLQGGKRVKLERPKTRQILSSEARTTLSQIATEFLENGFNTLMRSVTKDLSFEREKVRLPDYIRYFWLCGFFLRFQRHLSTKDSAHDGSAAVDYDKVSSVANLQGVMFALKRIRMSQDEKRFDELPIAVECLKELITTIEAMASSNMEEFQEISEHVQSNMFYESSIIDFFVGLVRNNKFFTLSYLQTIVETTHILLKMLQRFSDAKGVLFVRQKKRNKTAKKRDTEASKQAAPNENDESVENDENQEADRSNETSDQHDSNEEDQRKAADNNDDNDNEEGDDTQRFDERQLGVEDIERLSILEIFNCIMGDRHVLPSTLAHKELYQLIKYILGKFFKKLEEYPMLFLEILYPKIGRDVHRIAAPDEAEMERIESRDVDGVGVSCPFKHGVNAKSIMQEFFGGGGNGDGADESISFDIELTWNQKVGMLVGALLSAEKTQWLEWLKAQLTDAATDRITPPTAPDAADENEVEVPSFPAFELRMSSLEDSDQAMTSNRFTALLSLLEILKVSDAWTIPAELTAHTLLGHRNTIDIYMEEPLGANGNPVAEKVKKKVLKRSKRKGGSSNPNKGSRKRKAVEEMNRLSKEFISDSDGEFDELFWQREEEQRRATAAKHEALMNAFAGKKDGKKGKKSLAGGQTGAEALDSPVETQVVDDDDVMLTDDDVPLVRKPRSGVSSGQTSSGQVSSSDVEEVADEGEDVEFRVSQHPFGNELKELFAGTDDVNDGNAADVEMGEGSDGEDDAIGSRKRCIGGGGAVDDDDDVVVAPAGGKRIRRAIVFDSDDDE
ncbi:Topoisomerase 1-associated factor 1 [Rhizophlyctis rosea]|nr:Topoisomerase 1-associated factor 1 [Rhizophlyctis rosea]